MGKRKKRKIFQTAEEREAWEAHSQARIDELKYHIEEIKAELAARRKPA
jgi:hypothetical protein